VTRAAVVTHGKPETIGAALDQLQSLAAERGVELVFPDEELEKHGLESDDGDLAGADLAVVLERTNARALGELPFAPELVTCDVSFISVQKALPPALTLAAPGWQALVLVKPQFEAGRPETRRGVVRDPQVWRRVLRETAEAALGWQAQVAGVVDSGLPGPKGNREFFLHLRHAEDPKLPDDLDEQIDRAVAAG